MPSELYPGELVIDDSTPDHILAPPQGFGTGLDLSLRSAEGYGAVAQPFPPELIIPQSEWQARIEELEATKTRLSDIINAAGLPCKDQARTNYCWFNAPTHCLEIIRLVQGEPMVILSPASGAAPATNYANRYGDWRGTFGVGGWGKTALQWIIEHGVAPVSMWPANAIDPKYATDDEKAAALKYRVDLWWVLDGSIEQLISCLLRRIPIAAGLGWMGHEVTYVDPVWLNGAIGVRWRNSWSMNWPKQGAGGWSTFQGNKMLPDDAVAPVTALAA